MYVTKIETFSDRHDVPVNEMKFRRVEVSEW